ALAAGPRKITTPAARRSSPMPPPLEPLRLRATVPTEVDLDARPPRARRLAPRGRDPAPRCAPRARGRPHGRRADPVREARGRPRPGALARHAKIYDPEEPRGPTGALPPVDLHLADRPPRPRQHGRAEAPHGRLPHRGQGRRPLLDRRPRRRLRELR